MRVGVLPFSETALPLLNKNNTFLRPVTIQAGGTSTGLLLKNTSGASNLAEFYDQSGTLRGTVSTAGASVTFGIFLSNATAQINSIDTTAGNTQMSLNTRSYSTASINSLVFCSGTYSQTSGTAAIVSITPTYNQASGTAASTDLLVNRTETAVGSGSQKLLDLQVGGTTKFNITNAGVSNFTNTMNMVGNVIQLNASCSINANSGGSLLSVSSATGQNLIRSTTATASKPVAAIQQGASWTTNTIEFQNSSASILAAVDVSGNFLTNVAGTGYRTKEGSNAKQGTATLSAGTATVSNTSVTSSSRIFLTIQSLGTVAVPQAIGVTAITAATSFVITSASVTDTSVIAYEIFEPS